MKQVKKQFKSLFHAFLILLFTVGCIWFSKSLFAQPRRGGPIERGMGSISVETPGELKVYDSNGVNWVDLEMAGDAGINWSTGDLRIYGGEVKFYDGASNVNWTSIEMLSDVGINWSTGDMNLYGGKINIFDETANTNWASLEILGDVGVNWSSGDLNLYGTGRTVIDGEISNIDVPIVALSVAAESSDDIAVTVQIDENDGTNIAELCLVRLWLSDAAGGVETSTAPDGGGTAANGWITGTGTEFREETGEISYFVLTDSSGTIVVTFNDDDGDNNWYLNAEVDGKVFSSTIIDHQAP